MNNAFPYKAWVLMPSFKPVEIELTEAQSNQYHKTAMGKWYSVSALFGTKADAISEGRRLIEIQKADLTKRHANLMKRVAALDKAE